VAIVEAINGKICRTDTMQLVLVRLISARDNYVLGDPSSGHELELSPDSID